jgi:ribose transport system substrate-binding protein
MIVANSRLSFTQETVFGFRAGVSEVGGVDYTVTGPPGLDAPGAVRMFEEATATAKDGITVQVPADLIAEPLAAAGRTGIPLIAVEPTPLPGSQVKLYIGNDNYQLGQMLASEAIRRLPAGAAGTVVIGTPVPGLPTLDARASGIRDEFRKRLPRVQVLGPFDTKREPIGSLIAWRALRRANPHALALLGTGDTDAQSLAKLHKLSGGSWLAGAFHLDPRSVKAVKDGALFALVSPEHFLMGAIAGRLQAERAKSGKALPQGWIATPGLLATSANIDEIIRRQSSQATREQWFRAELDRILGDLSPLLRSLDQAR